MSQIPNTPFANRIVVHFMQAYVDPANDDGKPIDIAYMVSVPQVGDEVEIGGWRYEVLKRVWIKDNPNSRCLVMLGDNES